MRNVSTIILILCFKTVRAQVIDIPVVVHVLYHDAQDSVAAERITTVLLDSVNADFRRTNDDAINTQTSYLNIAADTEIQFHLATIDPDGNPSPGVIHHYTDSSLFGSVTNMLWDTTGGADVWDDCRYLNIYLGRSVGDDGVSLNNHSVRGLILRLDYYFLWGNDSVPRRYRGITHYLGHYLGLNDLIFNSSCIDDGVDDTPLQSSWISYPSCKDPEVFEQETLCPPGNNGRMAGNYMMLNYPSAVKCMNMFTLGQKARMREFIAERFIGFINPDLNCNVGVEDLNEMGDLILFPNPTHSSVTLRVPFNGPFSVRISDSHGRERLSHKLIATEGKEISVEHGLPQGVYHFTISSTRLRRTLRLMVL